MGHYSTARVLFKAGADPNPPGRLFRNIWDSNELKRMVKNLGKLCRPRISSSIGFEYSGSTVPEHGRNEQCRGFIPTSAGGNGEGAREGPSQHVFHRL